MISAARLAELRALIEAATPGPWVVSDDGWIDTFGGAKQITHLATNLQDAALIVAAVNSLPDLVGEIERLREELEFYADRDNYRESNQYLSIVAGDGGLRARSVLAGPADPQAKT